MAKGVLEKAMDYLALRPLSTCELRSKLSTSEHYTPEEIEEALEICCRRGYLNDTLLASDAAHYLNSCGKGERLIRKKLRARGISEEELSSALEEITPEHEEEAAKSAAEGKLRLLVREKDIRKKREKLFRFLVSRGFSPALAGNTVREVVNAPQEEEFPEDFNA